MVNLQISRLKSQMVVTICWISVNPLVSILQQQTAKMEISSYDLPLQIQKLRQRPRIRVRANNNQVECKRKVLLMRIKKKPKMAPRMSQMVLILCQWANGASPVSIISQLLAFKVESNRWMKHMRESVRVGKKNETKPSHSPCKTPTLNSMTRPWWLLSKTR